MDKNIANAMLLRLNKQDQIEALKSIGFTTVNENTPASDIAKYMQWSGTLLDLSLATLRIEDGEQVFFTASEWNSMSANNRSKYIRIGIRLRAECHQFIIAKSDCVDAGGNKTFKWGGYGTDLRGLKNYGSGNQGLYDTFDGKENTDVIIETLAGVKDTQGTVGAPAAEVARAYKACTLESDGIEDTTVWNLPALGELMLMAKYKTEINELITSMFGNQNIFANDWYWSSTEYDASSSWRVGFNYGGVTTYGRHAAVSTKYFWLSLLAIPFWFSSLLYFLTILLFAPEDLTILHDRFYQSQLGIFFLMLSSYFIITFLYVLVCHRQSRGDRSAADAPDRSVSA